MRPRPPCLRKAQDLLAHRAHFRAELAAKLGSRGYPEEEIEETLERLAAEGWLDDRKNALAFADSRLTRKPQGRHRLLRDLLRRGVEEEAARAAVDEAIDAVRKEIGGESGGEGELELARRAAARWRGTGEEALARHLDRLGFPRHAIFSVLREQDGAS